MFPIQNYDDKEENDNAGLKMDERPSRRGARVDEGDHDFGSSATRFFQSKPSTHPKDSLSLAGEGDRDFGSSAARFFQRKTPSGEQDESQRSTSSPSLPFKSRSLILEIPDSVWNGGRHAQVPRQYDRVFRRALLHAPRNRPARCTTCPTPSSSSSNRDPALTAIVPLLAVQILRARVWRRHHQEAG
jgi:hypothetical protein